MRLAKLEVIGCVGRAGHALPLGHAVQHTGEIDPANPIAAVLTFGTPTTPPVLDPGPAPRLTRLPP